jgi:hypothetical protein
MAMTAAHDRREGLSLSEEVELREAPTTMDERRSAT